MVDNKIASAKSKEGAACLGDLACIMGAQPLPACFSGLWGRPGAAIDESMLCSIMEEIRPALQWLDPPSARGRGAARRASAKTAALLRVLSAALAQSQISHGRFLECIGEQSVVLLVGLLKSRECTIRELSFGIVGQLGQRHGELAPLLEEAAANELASAGDRDAKGWVVRLLLLLVRHGRSTGEGCGLYRQFIVPVLLGGDAAIRRDAVQTFCATCGGCQMHTARYLRRAYAALDTPEQARALETLAVLLAALRTGGAQDGLEPHVSALLIHGLAAESHLVMDAVLSIFDQAGTAWYVDERIAVILPKVFPSLYRASKKFWRLEQRCRALRVIAHVVRVSHGLFERCLIDYNLKKLKHDRGDP